MQEGGRLYAPLGRIAVFFMIEYKEKKKRFFYNGTELAGLFIKYPYIEDFLEFSEFYEVVSQNAFDWFVGDFCEKCKAEYEQSDEKSRFGKAYRYSLDIRLKGEKKDFLNFEIKAILKRGRGEVLSERCEIQTWDIYQRIMVRPKKEKSRPRKK